MQDVISEYQKIYSTYQLHATRLETLVTDILDEEGIKVHFTESRAKDPDSVRDKISRPGKSYDDPLNQISDLVGVRVVLYYQDDVERVGEIIRREFTIIEEERSHQADKYSPDQFGYLSAHYIVTLNKTRSALSEWQALANVCAEIQVRTVLQHSWAAVSHALQYKREGDVPISLRRRLFRLASLFELADEQFIEIRDDRRGIAKLTQDIINKNDANTPIDAPIIQEVLSSSSIFKQTIKNMSEMGYSIGHFVNEDYLGVVVEEFERLRISTIEHLHEIISQDHTEYLAEAFSENDSVSWSVSEEFILYLLLIGAYPDQFSVEHLTKVCGWTEDIAKLITNSALKHTPNN